MQFYRIKAQMATQIDFEGKILAFTEEPFRDFWAGFLPVLSHDTYYTLTKFVAGEGRSA